MCQFVVKTGLTAIKEFSYFKMIFIAAGRQCSQTDLVFLVDSSGSIQRSNWPLILQFMQNVVTDFNIGPNDFQIGVALFGNNVEPQFQLNTYRYCQIVSLILFCSHKIPFRICFVKNQA